MHRAAELVALRPVLGVIDGEILAAGERQGIIHRLRLGARHEIRHDHDLEIAGQIERARSSDRVAVGRFEDQLDVELRGRVIEA